MNLKRLFAVLVAMGSRKSKIVSIKGLEGT